MTDPARGSFRTLYTCQKCGEPVGEGEQDRNGRHAYCGGELVPTGECDPDEID